MNPTKFASSYQENCFLYDLGNLRDSCTITISKNHRELDIAILRITNIITNKITL